MDSIFRRDIQDTETIYYLRMTNLVPVYLKSNIYIIPERQRSEFVTNVRDNTRLKIPRGLLNVGDPYITENLLKRCFNKCRQFVLEDWIDYDELDCTMKCTLLHKKSLNLMTSTYNKI